MDVMEALHASVAQELIDRIKSGDATAADISNAIKFLKDNGIEVRVDKNPLMTSLAHQFPVFDNEADTVQ